MFFSSSGETGPFLLVCCGFLELLFFSPLSLMSSRFLSLFGLMLYDVELYFFKRTTRAEKQVVWFFAVVNPLGLVYYDDNGG